MVYHICQPGYNQSQETAIHAAVRLCRVADTDPRVLLLQGPPGTGKSHTIIGIITAIVKVGGNFDKCIDRTLENMSDALTNADNLLCRTQHVCV